MKQIKWVGLFVCARSKEHFPQKHENIDFYTHPKSAGVGTHPFASYGYFRGHRDTSGVKKFSNKTRK